MVGTALMLQGENSREVAHRVGERLKQISASMPEGVVIRPVLDRTKLVDATIETVEHNLMLGALRSRGLAARYVSGYLLTRPPPGQPKLVGADASHAWVSVWLPDGGWFDVDPTNDVVPSEEHVTVAYGRDFADVTPLKGVILGGGAHTLQVAVDVSAVDTADG